MKIQVFHIMDADKRFVAALVTKGDAIGRASLQPTGTYTIHAVTFNGNPRAIVCAAAEPHPHLWPVVCTVEVKPDGNATVTETVTRAVKREAA